ncbi:hypothetical protein BBD42_14745 [Paenibacillus sp. BIHB 4019]|uniref:Holin n=1 Tax=Paenibacillus sp. BIHB 4019 TaxID=1870819 RepID=A0A1B2DIP8_9BACL|nr:phage holin family protein [Paenibacillus sp. BIHB 4019]ANY67592.1 hypothetical protein BBD42_14745 [Paenibacillus sp. BIHB 4019]
MFKPIFNVDITPGTTIAGAIGAFLAPWIGLIYGEGRLIPILLLMVVIGLDWITGIAASQKDTTYSSEYGMQGVLRTLFLLALPVLANLLDMMLAMPGLFFYAITIGLIYHTWQSLTANAYRAGWGKWIPEAVVKLIESELKAKMERATKRGADPTEPTESTKPTESSEPTERKDS